MWQDLRFGLRSLTKAPGFTAIAVLTLALGIGANTTIFSVVNTVLIRPLPYANPERILLVADTIPGGGPTTSSLPKFRFLHEHAKSFSAIAALTERWVQVSGPAPAPPAEIPGARVAADFFEVFGVKPAMGRVFQPNEGEPGATPVAVIADSLWKNRFGSDPSIIGKSFAVNGLSTAVIGVMPAGFEYPPDTQIWIPRIYEHSVITPIQIERGASYLAYYARLRGGVDLQSAEAELALLSRQYDASHPGFGDTGRTMSATPLRETLVNGYRLILLVLLGAVAFVLLIACANVANLLLARAVARQSEIAIRASLGASRRRLLVQFLTESVLLASLGAALGLAIAYWSSRVIRTWTDLPRAGEIHIDVSVLIFTLAVAVLTGVLFGLGPALQASRIDLNDALKSRGRAVAAGGKLREIMIASEVALAMILLTGAGLLMRSFLRLESVNPGYRTQNLVTMRVALSPQRYPGAARRVAFYDRVLERIAAIPGVSNAALANTLPPAGRAIAYFFNIEGRPALEPTKAPIAWMHSISPNYFQTLGVPLLAGRGFTEADSAGAPLVAIINQTMARRFWPDEDPVGQHIVYSREAVAVQIVGVAGDMKIGGLGDNSSYNILFVPYRQRPFQTMSIIARGPVSIAQDVRREILAIDRDQPVANIRTMEEAVADSVAAPRLRTALIAGFASLALILAAIGIGGMVAWSVTQRTNEIGIRMALGARPSNILGMILRQAFTMIGAGQIAGIIGAFALTRVLASFLFGISAADPLTFLTVALLLSLVALLASVFAARRALRVDPMIALRLS